jgi:GTPase SAR1 family protein
MVIEINSNKLCNERQTINFTNKVLTLVGENGCGKSSILEAVFEKYIEDEQIRTICFSSGQNELFTNLFYRHKQRNRRYLHKEENQYISSFYFNYDWVRVLVFFASVLKPNGKVREFLLSRGYIDVNGEEDVSSNYTFLLG